MSKSGEKPYQCADCGHVFTTWTNHHGSTWWNCKKCHNQNSRSLCLTDEGKELRKVEADNYIDAQLVFYNIHLDRGEGHRERYQWLLETLESMGTELWEVLKFQSGSVEELFKRYEITKDDFEVRHVKLSTDHLSANQWLIPEGPRVFDSHQIIYPNKNIKMGYYLKINDEIRKLRTNRLACGYCGYQSDEGKVGDQHCDAEKCGSTPVEVGTLRRVREYA
jgi:DNA-directed RNA polymerase subunit RPC12/RpoP